MNEKIPILLAEDNAGDVYLVRRALDKHGICCELFVIGDGAEALQFLEEGDRNDRPGLQLVLLDLNLPRHAGTEILARLRSSPKSGNAPVVVLTSSDSPRDQEAARQFGANHYFRKPADLAEFMELGVVVRDLLSARNAATA